MATAIVGITGMTVAAVACGALGFRVNTTRSIPVGFYKASDTAIEKGRYVLFCPTDKPVFKLAKERGYIGAGFCPGGYGYMMKKVLATKGDTVEVDAQGVCVNGVHLPLSAPRSHDGANRPMPEYPSNRYILSDSQVLLMSDVSEISFDARYFGPIELSQILTVIKPVITW